MVERIPGGLERSVVAVSSGGAGARRGPDIGCFRELGMWCALGLTVVPGAKVLYVMPGQD